MDTANFLAAIVNLPNIYGKADKILTANNLKEDVLHPDGEGNTIPYKLYDGIHYPKFPFLDYILSELPNFRIRDDDILISAFPKSGTNWLWEIATMIMRKSSDRVESLKFEGFLEYARPELFDGYKSPRILNTHVLPHLLPKQAIEKKAKMIFMLRNPKDVVQSLYHHSKVLYYYNGTFNGYFEVVMQGKNDYGSWFDYTLTWDTFLQTYAQDRQLILYYEDMKEDLSKHVKMIAKFLEVSLDDDLCEAIADRCGFQKMRESKIELSKNPDTTLARFNDKLISQWFRKGAVGEWKNYFTVAQNDRFDAKMKEKMKNCSFKFRYEL